MSGLKVDASFLNYWDNVHLSNLGKTTALFKAAQRLAILF